MSGIFLFEFFVLLVAPVLAVGVAKEALQMRSGPRFVYLAIGKREFLVLGGLFTIVAIYIGAIMVVAIVGGIVGAIVAVTMLGTSGGHADAAATIATTMSIARIIGLLFDLVLAYLFIRLGYLMVPVTTAEGRFGVWRSWQLTKGNFWRSVGVIAGTFLPLTIVVYGIWFAVFGPGMFMYMWDAQVHPERAIAELTSLIATMTQYGLYLWGFFLLLAPISYGIMLGQSVFAYRSLVGKDTTGSEVF
jgi:hypothetical protein